MADEAPLFQQQLLTGAQTQQHYTLRNFIRPRSVERPSSKQGPNLDCIQCKLICG
jgi:hypothetical protein